MKKGPTARRQPTIKSTTVSGEVESEEGKKQKLLQ